MSDCLVGVPPQAPDAEEHVLGALLTAGAIGVEKSAATFAAVTATGLKADDFYLNKRRVIFSAIAALVERGALADTLSVCSELERMGKLEKAGGDVYVRELAVLSPASANAVHWAKLVLDKTSRREQFNIARALFDASQNGGVEGNPELADRLSGFVSALKGLDSRGKKPSLPFEGLGKALAETPEEPRWVLNGYIARGVVTLLAGRPKVGKSTFAFGLFGSVLAGRPFVDRDVDETGILLLSEERPDSLAEKRRRFALGDSVHLLMRHQAGPLAWPDVVAQAVGHCADHGLGLLVVDTFDKWTGLRGDAENNAGDVLAALEPLQLAASQDLAVLIVAHQRKSAGEHGEAVRGSNALTGAVDVIVELERPAPSLSAGKGARLLRAVSRFVSTPEEIVVELEAAGYRACGDLNQVKAEGDRSLLLAALDACGEATSKQLHEETAIPDATVRERLNELLAQEKVARLGEGKKGDPYRWTVSFRADESLKGAERNSEALEAAPTLLPEGFEAA
jgi:hypothetical protein